MCFYVTENKDNAYPEGIIDLDAIFRFSEKNFKC